MGLFGRAKRKREVAEHVKDYREGRRLMRVGDPADEWFGMDLARRSLLALRALGRDEEGVKRTPADLDAVLRTHGLDPEKYPHG